ncbi:MAG: ABC transporter substrate-binding protein [Planctomycetes bacterium]|nr:ABC transporter substrate-binding protein [Planctomycetota bacterium]
MALLRAAVPAARRGAALLALLAAAGCNSPYPEADEGQSILYTTFTEEPRHLDPAQAYPFDDVVMMSHVLEPPLQFHYLKRPYALAPLTAADIPRPEPRKVVFQGETVEGIVYTVRLAPGIRYQDHPCFVEANRHLAGQDVRSARTVWDIQPAATRALAAGDYVYAIRRLADPRLACPIYSVLADHLLGMREYQESLQGRLDRERSARQAAAGPFYNQEQDERYNPIRLDYAGAADAFPFVREIDPHTFEVVLGHPYPQILYWMAMPFFSPVPPEAIEFFDQRVLLERSIVFDKNLVGTGPYVLREFDPTNQIVFQRNPNFRDERYPDLPQPAEGDEQGRRAYDEMASAGMLEDAGRRLPMVDRVVLRLEKELIPRWNKFQQGYYDVLLITSDVFDQAVTLTSRGDASLSDEMAARGVRLVTSYPCQTSYLGFNMADSIVGGYAPEQRKLRQAISMAFDSEEEIAIFANGQGIPAQGPIPLGIFGHREGREGINPVVYRWDEKRQCAVRRPLEEAKRLLAEAGYPNGFGPDGQRLVVRFATTEPTPESRTLLAFFKKQFDKLGIGLDIQVTDFNRFQEKVRSGNFQALAWGWIADYPDPETFLSLFYGPNGKVASGGENVANYRRERFDALFVRMRNLENTPERLAIIDEMVGLLREDAPWIFRYEPLTLELYHGWLKSAYPHAVALNKVKYRRIDAAARTAYRREYNRPEWWPVLGFLGLLVLVSLPAARAAARRLREA